MSRGKYPLLEIPYYQRETWKNIRNGKNQVALFWRLVVDAVHHFIHQGEANYILFPRELPFIKERAHLMQATQEVSYRFGLINPTALKADWIFDTGELQEVAEHFRYWMIYAQARDTLHFQQEIAQANEAAIKYRLMASEVAFFAQEAATHFKKIHDAIHELSPLELYRWKRVAYAAARAAMLSLHVEASLSWNNKILIHHRKEAARYGEQAFHFRMKAAMATQQGNEHEAVQWSLAAYAANNVCEAHATLLDIFPSGKEALIARWIEVLHAAEEAVRRRAFVAVGDNKSSSWEQAAFWSEHFYDCCLKTVEVTSSKNSLRMLGWEEAAEQAKQLASFYEKAASKKEQHARNPVSLYWRTKAISAEKKQKKRVMQLLSREVFFCLPKEILPYEMRQTVREEKERFLKIDSTLFRSWIYQTWKQLYDAGVPCQLSTYPVAHGINITLGACLPSSLRLVEETFFVDVVADTSEHPAAACHLLQNPIQAQRIPKALFIPHWPQAGLIPRDLQRGACFKNVVFLGESQNLASELRDKTWRQRLHQQLGLHFEMRKLDQWHDYHDVDCVIAIRDFSQEPHFYKPATKLYNAWLAGVPFIGGCDSAYAAEGHPGQDYLVATTLEEAFQHLKCLQGDPFLRSQLVEQGVKSGKAFTQEATLERWKTMVQETLPQLALEHQKKMKHGKRSFFKNTTLL